MGPVSGQLGNVQRPTEAQIQLNMIYRLTKINQKPLLWSYHLLRRNYFKNTH